MDAKQEFALKMMKLEEKGCWGPDTKADLVDCDRDTKEVEDWVATGQSGLPPKFYGKIIPIPTNHELIDSVK